MARGTTVRHVRLDDERWAALEEAAERDAVEGGRSAVIRDLIDAHIMPPPPRA